MGLVRTRQSRSRTERRTLVYRVTSERLRAPLELPEHDAPDVPELVREVAAVLELAVREVLIRAGRDAVHEREAERIGAEFLDVLDRAHHVALGLAHLVRAAP